VANVVEILDVEQEEEEDGAATDVDSQKKGKCAVIKTSTRQTIFLPVRSFPPHHHAQRSCDMKIFSSGAKVQWPDGDNMRARTHAPLARRLSAMLTRRCLRGSNDCKVYIRVASRW
jgi:hypothetical protein